MAIAREVKEPDLEARALNNLGAIHQDIGKPQDGISYLEEALKTARLHKNHEIEVRSLANLGLTFRQLKNYSEAFNKYEEALNTERRFLKRPKQETLILKLINNAYLETEQYSKMQVPAEDSVAVARKSGDSLILLDSLSLLVTTYMVIGNRLNHPHIGDSEYQNNPNSSAKQYARRSIQIAKEAEKIAITLNKTETKARLYDTLGANYVVLGDREKTAELYELAFKAYGQINEYQSEQLASLMQFLQVKSSIASQYIENLEQPKGIELSNEILALMPTALRLAKNLGDDDARKRILDIQSNVYRRMANTYEKSFDFPKAERFALEALNTAKQANNAENQIFSLDQLSSIYKTQGQYQKAYDLELQAIELSKRLAPAQQAGSLGTIASDYAVFGNYRKAIEVYNQSLQLYQKVDLKKISPDLYPFYGRGYISIFSFLSSSYQELGEFDLALLSLKQGIQLAQSFKLPSEEAEVLVRLGRFYLDRNEVSLASGSLREAETIVSKLKTPNNPYLQNNIKQVKMELLLQLIKVYIQQGNYSQAWDTVQKAQTIARQSSDRKIQQEINVLEKLERFIQPKEIQLRF
ncbi:MAG: tetratricopeptide repeat protein [Alkalinema sp. RU_4_3]|nr:tetratricopeptide repeat protein [Alkalinema sp. RU_4_3]